MSSNYSDRIKKVLSSQGITQKGLSERTRVSLKTVNNYVQGETTPSAQFLSNLCEEFSLSPAWMLMGEGKMQRGMEVGNNIEEDLPLLSPKRRTLVRDFLELIKRLQNADQFEDWLKSAGETGSASWIILEGIQKIEEFEWECLHEFLNVEKKILELQPRHLHRRRSQKPSAELEKAMEKAETKVAKIKNEFDSNIKSLERMWEGEGE